MSAFAKRWATGGKKNTDYSGALHVWSYYWLQRSGLSESAALPKIHYELTTAKYIWHSVSMTVLEFWGNNISAHTAVPSSCLRDYCQSISGPLGKQEDQTHKSNSINGALWLLAETSIHPSRPPWECVRMCLSARVRWRNKEQRTETGSMNVFHNERAKRRSEVHKVTFKNTQYNMTPWDFLLQQISFWRL